MLINCSAVTLLSSAICHTDRVVCGLAGIRNHALLGFVVSDLARRGSVFYP